MALDVSNLTTIVNNYLNSISDLNTTSADTAGLGTSSAAFSSLLTDAINTELAKDNSAVSALNTSKESSAAAPYAAKASVTPSISIDEENFDSSLNSAILAKAAAAKKGNISGASIASDPQFSESMASIASNELASQIQAAAHKRDPGDHWFEQTDFPDIENMIRQSMMSRMRIEKTFQ